MEKRDCDLSSIYWYGKFKPNPGIFIFRPRIAVTGGVYHWQMRDMNDCASSRTLVRSRWSKF
ncbi:hypothetical protein [Lacticaseibacillus suibinensis]|uniref:hypothetical protein n=1 Tax=Lacticaseibacillus suibinensis TaxID=2486011 RepID=UPI0013DD8BFA|nr:hypothetical protein [Lacticaseibacillus suibinensis]